MPHRLGALTNNSYLRVTTPTYYQHLRDNGYWVGCVGKLDLAKPDWECGQRGNLPRTFSWGFTHPVECIGRMDVLMRERRDGVFSPMDPYTYWLDKNGMLDTLHRDLLDCKGDEWLDKHLHDSYLPTEAWGDVYIANRSAQWIAEIPEERPWHLFVSFVGPHDPFNAPTEYADLFRDADAGSPVPPSLEGKPAWIRKKASSLRYGVDTPVRTRRQYAACIAAIDAGIGRLIDALKRRDALANTVIMFTADHGEMLLDQNLFGKSVAYEASMRVPLFVTGPGIARGKKSGTLVELIDVGETICDIADTPSRRNVDARSFLPVATGRSNRHRDDAVSSLHSWNAIRTNRYKYIESYNDDAELYDLREDPDETTNVVAKRRDVASALCQRMRERMMAGVTG
jgi:choline-sulfatase